MSALTASGSGWERHGESSFVFADPAHGVILRLRNVRQDGGYSYADVHAYEDREDGQGEALLLLRPRINLTSDGGIRTLSAALGTRLPDYNWRELLERVCVVLVQQYDRKGEITRVTRAQALAVEEMFTGIIPVGYVSGILAHGGVGKTLVADMLALAVATGHTVGPFRPTRSGPVAIIDFENDHVIHDIRISRLCLGLGIGVPENIVHYRANTGIVAAEADVVEMIHEAGAIVTIIDSIGFAAAGELRDSGTGITTMNVIKRLPGTKVMLAHPTKEDARAGTTATPIGSVFFFNGCQSLYSIRATEPELDGSFTHVIDQVKANVGRKLQRPLGARLIFEDPDGPIRVEPFEVRGDAPGGEGLSLSLRIRDFLGRQPHRVTDEEIAMGLGMEGKGALDSISRKLRDMRTRGIVHSFGGGAGGRGQRVSWGLAAREDGDQVVVETPPPTTSQRLACHICGDELAGYDSVGRPVCGGHLE